LLFLPDPQVGPEVEQPAARLGSFLCPFARKRRIFMNKAVWTLWGFTYNRSSVGAQFYGAPSAMIAPGRDKDRSRVQKRARNEACVQLKRHRRIRSPFVFYFVFQMPRQATTAAAMTCALSFRAPTLKEEILATNERMRAIGMSHAR